jgi:DNA-binding transcriptional LysR family regulator
MDPALTTDQVATFVQLANLGSLREAARSLYITEQGARNRLLALEQRLGVQLYHKARGPRRRPLLTEPGRRFLPHAIAFLNHARDLVEICTGMSAPSEIHVVATQYLILYVLIEAVHRFHLAFPTIRVRLSNRTEQEIEDELVRNPELALGVAAPYEPPPELNYQHLFSMDWSLITPPRHPLSRRGPVGLEELCDVPLILFERGSTGRQHVMEAFHGRGLAPRIDMEMTNTEIAVRMVEAGLGVSIVPLLPNGAVTRGRRVAVRSLGKLIRPINSGILTRRSDILSPASQAFIRFLSPAR